MTNQNWIAFQTIVWREIKRFSKISGQTILPAAITMSLYFVIFGSLMGKRIGTIDGVPYIQYIAPGLIMMSVITNAYANVSFSFFFSKFQGNIEELLISPTPSSIILLGYICGGVARGVCVGIAVMLVTLFFTHLTIHHIGIMLISILIASALFALAGFINAQFARTFDGISFIPTFVLTPMTYLGGIFYSIYLLPDFWQKVSLLNPILYLVNTFRYGMLGISDVNVKYSLLACAIVLAIVYSIAWLMLEKGLRIKK